MASSTQWIWVWVNSGSWWWTWRPDMLQAIGSQRVEHNWVTELTELIPEWSSGFPYFLPLKVEFCNNEFLIWATVCSWSCFCWLYRTSPSAAKNVISLTSVLTIWWCPCVVISCVVGRGCLLWPVCSVSKTLLAFALLLLSNKKNQFINTQNNLDGL